VCTVCTVQMIGLRETLSVPISQLVRNTESNSFPRVRTCIEEGNSWSDKTCAEKPDEKMEVNLNGNNPEERTLHEKGVA
jgi:hypothetical protein